MGEAAEEKRRPLDSVRRQVDLQEVPWDFGRLPLEQGHYHSRREIAGSPYEFLFFPKEGADRLFVFFHGYFSQKTAIPPVFQRWRWAEEFPGHCLYLADPALPSSEQLYLAWFSGAKGTDHLAVYSQIINAVAARVGVPAERIWTYGSSGGGYAALRSLDFLPGANAVAVNAQTRIGRYYEKERTRFARLCYGVDKVSAIPAEYKRRISLFYPDMFAEVSSALVVQNMEDTFHVENHYHPFLEFVEEEGLDQISTFEFSKEGGHSAVEDGEPFAWIKDYIERKS